MVCLVLCSHETSQSGVVHVAFLLLRHAHVLLQLCISSTQVNAGQALVEAVRTYRRLRLVCSALDVGRILEYDCGRAPLHVLADLETAQSESTLLAEHLSLLARCC